MREIIQLTAGKSTLTLLFLGTFATYALALNTFRETLLAATSSIILL